MKRNETQIRVLTLLENLREEMVTTRFIATTLGLTVDATKHALKQLHRQGMVMVSKGKIPHAWMLLPEGAFADAGMIVHVPAIPKQLPTA